MTHSRRNKLLESSRRSIRTGRRISHILFRSTGLSPDEDPRRWEDGINIVHPVPLQSVRLIDILNKPAYRSQLVGQFVNQCSVTHGHENTTKWESFLPVLAVRTQSADLASSALSCACLARVNKDDALLHEASSLHARALGSLQRELVQKQGAFEDANLAACMTLVSFQLYCEAPSLTEWAAHLKGIKSILQLRGPHAFAVGIAHHMYLAFRLTLMLHTNYAGLRPSSNFLASTDWKTLPWSINPKSNFHELLDIVADLPLIDAGCVGVDQCTGPDFRAMIRRSIIKDAWTLEFALKEQWYANLPLEVKSVSSVGSTRFTACAVDSTHFPQRYIFADSNACSILMVYWTCLLALYSALECNYAALQGIEMSYLIPDSPALLRCPTCSDVFAKSGGDLNLNGCRCGWVLQQPTYDISGLPEMASESTMLAPAHNISMSLEYCVQEHAKSWAAAALVWPTNRTLQALVSRWPSTRLQISWWTAAIEHFQLGHFFKSIPFWRCFLQTQHSCK